LRPSDDDLRRLAEMIDDAGSVTIFGGERCRDAHDEVVELAEKLQAPVGYAYRGKQWLEWGNPNAVGMTGLLGWGGAHQAMHNCDLCLQLGLCGDGGLSMLIGDLLTIAERQLPVKLVVLNNGGFQFVHIEQEEAGIQPYGTKFANPDWAKVADRWASPASESKTLKRFETPSPSSWPHRGRHCWTRSSNRTRSASHRTSRSARPKGSR